MKSLLFIILLLQIVSCQDTNSNSLDILNFGQEEIPEIIAPEETEDPGAARFNNALVVLNTQCVNCHTGYHAAWATDYPTEQAWIDGNSNGSDIVVPGDTDASSIVSRLQVWGTVNTTMPFGEPALTNEEFTILDDWIRNL